MAKSAVNRITQGNTFTLKVTPRDADGQTYDLSVGSWSCEVGVYHTTTGAELARVASSSTTDGDTAFVAHLLPTITAALEPGQYVLAAQVDRSDSDPVLSIESNEVLVVEAQYIK